MRTRRLLPRGRQRHADGSAGQALVRPEGRQICADRLPARRLSHRGRAFPRARSLMPSQHRHSPVSFRPPEADRAWLLEHAKATGKAVNAVLTAALAAYREPCKEAFRVVREAVDKHEATGAV